MLCKEEKSHKYEFWHLASCYISRIWIREGFPYPREQKRNCYSIRKLHFDGFYSISAKQKSSFLVASSPCLCMLMINLIRSSSRNFASSSLSTTKPTSRQTDGSRTIKPWSKNMINFYLFSSQITGAAQIIIGTSLLWGHVGYYGIVQNKLWAPPAILLALGPFTFILCWMGCQATNQKKRCLLGLVSGFKDTLLKHILNNGLFRFSFVLFWWLLFAYSSLYADGLLQCGKAFLLTWRYT